MSEPMFIRKHDKGGFVVEAIPCDGDSSITCGVSESEWPRLKACIDAGIPWKPLAPGGMLMDLDRWYEKQKGQADE